MADQTKVTHENAEACVNAISHLPLHIEIVGDWVWVDGNTKPHREELKHNSLRWARKKKKWYWRAPEHRSTSRRYIPYDAIVLKYGATVVRTEEEAD